jgi:predicted protein tyrosine phosphatase
MRDAYYYRREPHRRIYQRLREGSRKLFGIWRRHTHPVFWERSYTSLNGNRILILSAAEAARFTSNIPYVLISIDNPGSTTPMTFAPDPNREAVLSLWFADRETPGWGVKIFSEADARAIVEFLVRKNPQNVVVHCKAGLCRSAAVAAGIRYFFDHPQLLERDARRKTQERITRVIQQHYYPNKLVLFTMFAYIDSRSMLLQHQPQQTYAAREKDTWTPL